MQVSDVKCYSGHTYAQQPESFGFDDQTHFVAAIAAEWVSPEGKTFLVRTDCGRDFELTYTQDTDTWQVSERPTPSLPSHDKHTK